MQRIRQLPLCVHLMTEPVLEPLSLNSNVYIISLQMDILE